jgi:dTDP-4-dehydrorhamnose reductase
MELGTIVITGATGQVGQQLLSSLQGKCQAAIALVRQPANLPATEVITDWMKSPIAKLLPWVVRDLPSALVDVMLAESIGDPQRAVQAFDLKLTSLRQAWTLG